MEIRKALGFNDGSLTVDVVDYCYNTDLDKLIEWSGAEVKEGKLVIKNQIIKLGYLIVKYKSGNVVVFSRSSFQNNFRFEGKSSWKEPTAMGRFGQR